MIRLNQIHKSYAVGSNKMHVLKGIDMHIKEGDLVLLDRKGLNWATEKNEDLKLKSKRLGPFKVLEIYKNS